jgi:hypothetical protein
MPENEKLRGIFFRLEGGYVTEERRKWQNEELHNSHSFVIKSRKMRWAGNKECTREFRLYILIQLRRMEDNFITGLSIGRISLGCMYHIHMLKEVENSSSSWVTINFSNKILHEYRPDDEQCLGFWSSGLCAPIRWVKKSIIQRWSGQSVTLTIRRVSTLRMTGDLLRVSYTTLRLDD